MNILQVKKYYLLIKGKIIKQAKFPNSPLEKAFEKQIGKEVGAIMSLKPSNKKDQL